MNLEKQALRDHAERCRRTADEVEGEAAQRLRAMADEYEARAARLDEQEAQLRNRFARRRRRSEADPSAAND